MFAQTTNRFLLALPTALGFGKKTGKARSGPQPTWLDDPQLSVKMLRDTGLSAEDFGHQSADLSKPPSISIHSYW